MSPRAPDQSYEDFVMEHLPWLTGSLGTVLLDFTVSSFWETKNFVLKTQITMEQTRKPKWN